LPNTEQRQRRRIGQAYSPGRILGEDHVGRLLDQRSAQCQCFIALAEFLLGALQPVDDDHQHDAYRREHLHARVQGRRKVPEGPRQPQDRGRPERMRHQRWSHTARHRHRDGNHQELP
jgi:hypothetical protein